MAEALRVFNPSDILPQVKLLDQAHQLLQQYRLIPRAVAHNYRRDQFRFVKIGIDHIMAHQMAHRGGDKADAGTRSHQPERRLQFPDLKRHIRLDAPIPVKAQDLIGIAGSRRFRVEDQRLKTGLVQFEQPSARKQRMSGRQGCHHLVFPKHNAGYIGILKPQPAKSDVNSSIFQGCSLFQRIHFEQNNVNFWPFLPESADQLGQSIVKGRGDKADAELADMSLTNPSGHGRDFVHTRQNLSGLLVKIPPRLGKGQRTATVQQPRADLVFQLLDLAAERGLGNIQLFRRSAETALGGDGSKIAQMTKFHVLYLPGIKIDINGSVRQARPPLLSSSINNNALWDGTNQMTSQCIEKVETFLVDLPTIRPHRLSMTVMSGQTLMILRLYCSDGTIGLGEATTIGGLAYGAESPESMKLTIDKYIAPLLLGENADNINALMARIRKSVFDNHFAKCAVETALFDALGKRKGMSVSDLLGGRLQDRLPVAWTLASGDTAKDIAEAQEMLARRRHNIFKLKIGRNSVRADIAHVAAIKRALGDSASVRVDVNQAWSESMAGPAIAALEDAGVDLVEQPIALSNRRGMARLAAKTNLAIMADEPLHGPETAFDYASSGAATVFAVKILQSGGLSAAARVAAIADAAGIGLYGGTMLEGAVATVASAHLFSTLPHLEWGTELFGPLLLTEEILTEPLDYSEFSLKIPDGPGLGIVLDEARLNRFRRDGAQRSVHVVNQLKTGS